MARVRPDHLPGWPRLMGHDLAAAYIGLSPDTAGVARRKVGRRVLYDREDLDRFADRLAGPPRPAGTTRSATGLVRSDT